MCFVYVHTNVVSYTDFIALVPTDRQGETSAIKSVQENVVYVVNGKYPGCTKKFPYDRGHL